MGSSDDNKQPDPDRLVLQRYDLERMNLPDEFWRVKIDGVVDPDNRRVVSRYLRTFDERYEKCQGLLLYGDPGVGKTSIAALIAKEARARKKTTFFVMIWDLRECVRARWKFDENTNIMDRCREVDVLVLDGFVEEDINEKFVNARTLEQLITHRGQRGKLTIVTTRIDKKEFKTGAGLKAFGAGTEAYLFPLKVKGENLRTTRKQEMRDDILGED